MNRLTFRVLSGIYCASVLIILAICLRYTDPNPKEPHLLREIAFATIAIGVLTFLYFLVLFSDQGTGKIRQLGKYSLRTPLAAAVIIQYLVLAGIVAYIPVRPDNIQVGEITKKVIDNFTFVVIWVVAFYFGSPVMEQWTKRCSCAETPPASKQAEALAKPDPDA